MLVLKSPPLITLIFLNATHMIFIYMYTLCVVYGISSNSV